MEACNVNIAVASTMLISRSLGDTLSLRYRKRAFHHGDKFCGTRSICSHLFAPWEQSEQSMSTFSDVLIQQQRKKWIFAQYSLYPLPHSTAGTCSITTREEQWRQHNTNPLFTKHWLNFICKCYNMKNNNTIFKKCCTVTFHGILRLKETV